MIGRALKQLRMFNALSQTELSNAIDVSNSYLSEIEAGKKDPSLEVIEKYSRFFKIPVSSILYFSENMNQPNRRRKHISSKVLAMLEFISDEEEESSLPT